MKITIIVGNLLFALAWPLGGYFAEGMSEGQDTAGRGYAIVLGYLFAYIIFNPFIAVIPLLKDKNRKKASRLFTFLAFLPLLISALAVVCGGLAIGYSFVF